MNTGPGIAAVTWSLRARLQARLARADVKALLGGTDAEVTVVPPDSIEAMAGEAPPRLNLFLFEVSHDSALRVQAVPGRAGSGAGPGPTELALDLHYLLTAYGRHDLQAELLLGVAVGLFQEIPIVPWIEVRAHLPPEVKGGVAEPLFDTLRISPRQLQTAELSALWSALRASYRLSVAYTVSVVLTDGSDHDGP